MTREKWHCPACLSDWTGEKIPEESRIHFGWRLYFKRECVGIDAHTDRPFCTVCPDCLATFDLEWNRTDSLTKDPAP